MAKRTFLAGVTSQTIDIFIQDSSSTIGAGLAGLVFNTAGLKAYYRKGATGSSTAITLATLATVGTAWATGGFIEIDATNMKGMYRLDVPDTVFASSPWATLYLYGAANMAPVALEVEIVGYNPFAALATPTNITAGTITTVTTVTNQLTAAAIATGVWQDSTSGDFTTASSIGKSLYTAGVVPGGTNGLFIAGTNAATAITTALTANITGNLSGSVGSVTGAVGSVTGNVGGNVTGSVGSVATGGITRATFAADTGLQTTRSNTAQAGAASTITLDASASATDNIYKNQRVYLTGGTGAGQVRIITAYVGSTKVATVSPAWTTNPDNTSTFAVQPAGPVDVETIKGTASAGAAGYMGIDWSAINAPTTTVNLSGTTIATLSGQLTAAQIATGVWTDTTAGDFTTALSVGKSVMNGVALGTGLTINGYTGNTPQTGDSFARIGSNGVGLTNIVLPSGGLANVTAWTVAITGNITGNLSGSVGSVTGSVGSVATGGLTRASFAADTGLQSIRSNTAQAGAGSTITLDAASSATNDFYKDAIIYLTGGTGAGQHRLCTGYVGATKVATVTPAWATNPDNTSTFAVLPHGIVDVEAFRGTASVGAAGYAGIDWSAINAPTSTQNLSGTTIGTVTGQLTAAQVATAVWQDTTSGDFTVASSIGKSLYTSGVVPGGSGGLFIAGSNAATTVNFTGSLSGSVGSVTARVTANTDQLAGQTVTAAAGVTFPTSVASPTNITAGTISTVTNLTNAPTNGDLTAAMKASVTNAAWDATLSSHLTPGSTGAALNAAGAAGDPWSTSIPGAYGAGTAGYIVGNNLDAQVSTRLATSGYTAPDNADILLIKAKTDNLPASPAAVGSAMTLTAAYDFAKGTVAMTESYAANGVAPTPVQALYAIHQDSMDFAITGTSYTVKKLDNATTAFVKTLNNATSPTAAART